MQVIICIYNHLLIHPTSKIKQDIMVALGFACINSLIDGAMHNGRTAIMCHIHVIFLGAGRQRKEQIANLVDSRRDEQVRCHVEFALHEAFVPFFRLSTACARKKVRRLNPRHANRVRLTRDKCIQRRIGMPLAHVVAEEGILVVADELRLELGAQIIPAHAFRRALCFFAVLAFFNAGISGLGWGDFCNNLTTRDIHIAGNGHKGNDAVTSLIAVLILIKRKAPRNGGRLCIRVHTSCFINIFNGDFADFCCFFGSYAQLGIVNTSNKLIKTVAPFCDKIMVVKIFVENDPQPCHGHGGIGARTHAQMNLRTRREPINARINANHLGTALHQVNHRMAEQTIAIRCKRHLAPHDHYFRHAISRVIVGAL